MTIKKVIHWGGVDQRELGNQFFLGSVITVFTWISKYITLILTDISYFFYLLLINCWNIFNLNTLTSSVTSAGYNYIFAIFLGINFVVFFNIVDII